MSEWLRRWTRNPLGSARRGSNSLGVDVLQFDVKGLRPALPRARMVMMSLGGTDGAGSSLEECQYPGTLENLESILGGAFTGQQSLLLYGTHSKSERPASAQTPNTIERKSTKKQFHRNFL